jgi:L-alanine-DL-glutamate epimerase-like enolase superfamily enzyme
MTVRERPGAHAERAIPVGTVEVALWDLVAKIEHKPLHCVFAERFNGGKTPDQVFCYVGGGFGTEVRIENGYATLPQSRGIGFEAQPELFAVMRSLVPGA